MTWAGPSKFGPIKDSGERVNYASGMRRDIDEGKPRYDLVDEALLSRWAAHMAAGADKYGEDNWRLANSDEERRRFTASAWRHFVAWTRGDTDEDHAAAVCFNIAAAEYVAARLAERWAIPAVAVSCHLVDPKQSESVGTPYAGTIYEGGPLG